jgi:hypothetical protein
LAIPEHLIFLGLPVPLLSSHTAYHLESPLILDGKDYAIGNSTGDMRSAKKIDANTILFVVKKAGKEVRRWQITVSKDGKTQTVTGNGITPKGQAYSGTFVYEKQ